MMKMLNLVVFASGNGTTLQAIVDAIFQKKLAAKINLVVSNNPEAYALIRAKNSGIETYRIKKKTLEEQDTELVNILSNFSVDLIVLAGYLKKIGPKLIEQYKIINTHPSLLPKFGGKGMYGMKVHQAVVDAKEKITGVTLHWVNSNYDEGEIIAQTTVKVLPTDTAEDVAKKVQAVEKIQLVEVLQTFSLKK